MKKITMRRRMISLTLAASVALPQASSAFAASLWDEDGVSHKVAQAIESGQPTPETTAMPWVTLPADDNPGQSTPTPEMPSVATDPPGVTAADRDTQTSSPDPGDPTTPANGVDKNTPMGGGDSSTLTEGVDKVPPTNRDLIIVPGHETTPPDKNGEGSESPPPAESVTPTTDPTDEMGGGDKDGLPDPGGRLPDEEDSAGETTPVPTPPESPDEGEELPSEEDEKADLSEDLTTSETVGGEEITNSAILGDEALPEVMSSAAVAMPFSTDGAPLTQWMYYRLGYGVPISGSRYKAVDALDRHFAVESTEGGETGPAYGYRDYGLYLTDAASISTFNRYYPYMKFDYEAEVRDWKPYSVCVFPSADQLGRVPDQQLEGWYVYPAGAKANQEPSAAMYWIYGDVEDAQVDGEMSPVTLYDYKPGDPYFNEKYQNSDRKGMTFGALGDGQKATSLGDTWDGGHDYGYGHVLSQDAEGNLIYGSGIDDYGVYWGVELGNGNVYDQELEDWFLDPVSFVAKWEPSDKSWANRVTLSTDSGTALELYSSGSYVDKTSFAPGENGGSYEYWVRVDADVDSISLSLDTEELYYNDYNGSGDDYGSYQLDTTKSHVTVSAAFGGTETSYTNDHDLSAQMLPKWGVHPANSPNDPAHSEWSVKSIALRNATEDSAFNDIVITVTSPSGKVTTTYTFHVQRLSEPTLTRAWGNTPLGMIRRDDGYLGSADAKAAAEKYFDGNRTFDFGGKQYPNGTTVNNDGTIFRNGYSVNAWLPATGDAEKNIEWDVDKDETAIVVYLDSCFRDPGVSLVGTTGETVDLTKGTLERSLKLKQAAGGLSASLIGTGAGTDCWYKGGTLVDSKVWETVSEAGGTDLIDLRGFNILPGIYTLEYRYTDPISGKVYGLDPGGYVTPEGKKAALAFRRTVVVLPTPGDVDMDGAVTVADAITLQSILRVEGAEGASYTTLNRQQLMNNNTGAVIASDPVLTLYAFRVCDMNYDGRLDSRDIELLKALPNPKVRNEINSSNSDYFYLPLPPEDRTAHYTRKELAAGKDNTPKFEMVYLGKEGAKFQELNGSYMDNIAGPWNALQVEELEDGSVKNAVELYDIFWLGVRLNNADSDSLPLERVRSFSFTLVYDSQYVTPAVVLDEDSWNSVVTGGAQGRWERMMTLYNLSANAKGRMIWTDTMEGIENAYQLTTPSGWGRRFTTHYSTAQVALEKEPSAMEPDRLQSITFSVELKDGAQAVNLQNGQEYLLVVPFQMIKHPFGKTTTQLVEFEAGMRGITLVGDNSGTTYAYSSQDAIFGGKTRNLKDLGVGLSFANAGADIPLGENNTPVYTVYNYIATGGAGSRVNGVYASSFMSTGGWIKKSEDAEEEFLPFGVESQLSGELPPGLTFDSGSRQITGVPEKAGTYEFFVGAIPYRMTIDKAPLHYWAENKSSYYGQTELRGYGADGFTFQYEPGDICSFEQERAKNNGIDITRKNGADLGTILGDSSYTQNQPTFTAKTAGGSPVSYDTPVGNYSILAEREPKAENYEFIYGRPGEENSKMELTIMRRPIQVVQINGSVEKPTVLGSIFNDEGVFLGTMKASRGANVGSGQVSFTVRLATMTNEAEGYYNGYPLTPGGDYQDGVVLPNDQLQITFSADCIQTDYDKSHSGSFAFRDGNTMERRDARVYDIRFTGGTNWENYVLVSSRPDHDVVTDGVVGEVKLRRILSLRISQLDANVLLKREYGGSFTRSNELWLYLELDGGGRDGDYAYSSDLENTKGISAYWATAEEKEAYESGNTEFDYENSDKLPLSAGQVFDSVSKYNGRYVCLMTTTRGDEGNDVVLRCYSDEPLEVTPRTLTLTATPGHRFYGEENGTLHFTYDPKALALIDQRDGLTGDGEELLTVLADTDEVKHSYRAPRLEAMVNAADPTKMTEDEIAANRLTVKTPYTGSDNSVVIWGAKSDNYRFTYTYPGGGTTTTTRNDYGASVYKIERRLIVVEGVATSTPLVDIYADTHRIYTDGRKLTPKELVLGLPDHTESGTTYYSWGATSTVPSNMDITYAEGATAVVNGDELSFTYTATVVPTDGLDYAKYVDFSHGYFNMNDVDEEKGYKEYPLQISNLRMERTDEWPAANNYTIVYKHPDQRSTNEMPDNLVEYKEGTFRPEIMAEHLYYAAGVQNEDGTWPAAMARVYLRPIVDIRLSSVGKTEYTYGETYDPSQGDNGIGDRGAMMIHIEYENDPRKNNYAENPYIGDVQYRVAGSNNGQAYTTFEARSINIYYVKNGQTVEDAIEKEQIIGLNSPLFVNEHDGVRLVVAGKRGDQKDLVTSQATTSTLNIAKKTLTLTGEDHRRVYGENNPASFDFTFRAGDLARWDREALGLSALDGGTSAQLAQLSQDLGYKYVAPAFSSQARPNSDVLNGGREGYPITNLTGRGELENYDLRYEPGTLYIYPRTVNIQRFISSGDAPIYTIFSDVGDTHIFYTNATNVVKEEDGTTWSQFELGRASYGYVLGDGTTLPSTGEGLYPGDEVTLKITVSFAGANVDFSGSEVQENVNVTVTNAELVAGTRAASNYVLQTEGSGSSRVASIAHREAIGRVELRNIASISIRYMPVQMEYTYGEALSLAGLSVEIRYAKTESESGTGKTELIPYIGTDQFAAYGLHVYYYDSPILKETSWENVNSNRYRMAATGDHLTIAYTHDSQLPDAKYPDFSANGKYLVVTAQLPGLDPSEPVIVKGTDSTKPNFGQPVAIKVNPLPITFTLSAEDKIYDGKTEAAGTITFTNIINNSNGDSWNREGITDLVYPVIGANYEERWTSPAVSTRNKFADFKDYVTRNGYSFTTGSYVANDPSIFAENQTLNWTAGYRYGAAGTLTFSYLDPNVAYAQAPEHDLYGSLTTKEVQVTGLRLAGPDAANYTLVGKRAGETVAVTTSNATTAQGYLGRTSGLPTATIHKANRASLTTELIPQVELDPHTNVVRVNYDQSLSAITGGEENIHQDELHFEFALQKVLTETAEESGEGLTVTDVIQWAGKNGEYKWDDPSYFGGEAAPMTGLEITTDNPEAGAYVPREEDIPKPDSINENTTLKGQVYQWKELDDGFTLDLAAYPGGVYWPGYELYTIDRTALDRDAVYLAVVRAAETHNYNASPALSSVEDYTSTMVQAILDAQAAKETAATGAAYEAAQMAYEEAVQAASEPLLRAFTDAQEAAQAEVDALMAAGEKGSKLEERPMREAAPAVKTYKQVIETVSVKAYQGFSEDKNKKGDAYQVPTLEAIWFTDMETLPSKEVLDAVVWNTNPTRYRRYGYDSAFAAELKFTEEPISLRGSFEIEIPRKGEEGPELIRFNEDSNARFYVDTTFPSSSGGSINPDLMVIRPSGIMALLGDKPVLLEAVFYPAWTRPAVVQWSSSDPEVAIVDNMGRVSFVGLGTAVITATVPGGYSGAEPVCSASILVTVAADWKQDYPNSIFDFGNQDAFLVSTTGAGGESDRLFKPEMGITRGETAKLLAQFYVANPGWSKRGPEDFTDLTGEEDYAEAAKLLGHLGVFMGYPEGDFAGEQYISRAEFVTLLARMTGLHIEDTAGQAHAFLDTGEEDTWAYAEIDALSRQTGILYGVGEGYFAPDRNITRSEVAALLVRLLRFPATRNEELIVPIDVEEEHWARECILRAVNGSRIVETNLLWDDL